MAITIPAICLIAVHVSAGSLDGLSMSDWLWWRVRLLEFVAFLCGLSLYQCACILYEGNCEDKEREREKRNNPSKASERARLSVSAFHGDILTVDLLGQCSTYTFSTSQSSGQFVKLPPLNFCCDSKPRLACWARARELFKQLFRRGIENLRTVFVVREIHAMGATPPNDQALRSATTADVERKKDSGI